MYLFISCSTIFEYCKIEKGIVQFTTYNNSKDLVGKNATLKCIFDNFLSEIGSPKSTILHIEH